MKDIIVNDLKEFFRDKSSLFFTIFFPIILVFILGNLLEMWNNSETIVGELNIAYYVDSNDDYKVKSIEQFLKGLEKDEAISLKKLEKLENSANQYDSIIALSGSPMEVTLYKGNDDTKNNTINAIMSSYLELNDKINYVMSKNNNQIPEITFKDEYISPKNLGTNRNMIDYYAVTMTVMIVFMTGGIAGSESFQSLRKNNTIDRLIISPKSKLSIFIGKMIGFSPMIFVQLAVVMFVSWKFLKANYAASFLGNIQLIMMLIALSYALISFSSFLGILFNFRTQAIMMPLMWVTMFFGGTFSREVYVEKITPLMPPYIVQKAAFDLINFNRFELVNKITVVSLILFVTFTLTGGYIFSKRRETA